MSTGGKKTHDRDMYVWRMMDDARRCAEEVKGGARGGRWVTRWAELCQSGGWERCVELHQRYVIERARRELRA